MNRSLPDDPYSLVMPPAKPAEQRRERRYMVNQPAEIIRVGGTSWSVRIRDISTRGMQVVVDQPVTAGPDIRIRWNSREIRGTVRYKRSYDEHSFSIGVELREASPTLVIDMLKKQTEETNPGSSLVEEQKAVLQNYLALQELATDWEGVLAQPMMSPKRYGALLNQASDAMIVTSMDGTILFWNKAAEQMYGWTMDEVYCRQAHQIYETGPGGEGDVRHRRKDGSEIRVRSCSIIQQDAAGEPEAVIFINRKIED